jgi:hypothetical protein
MLPCNVCEKGSNTVHWLWQVVTIVCLIVDYHFPKLIKLLIFKLTNKRKSYENLEYEMFAERSLDAGEDQHLHY